MRSYNALPLDDDILGQIFTFCPTFSALKALILVSKAFSRVFQAQPKSITRAVAYNMVGPAPPQALRVVRYPYDKYPVFSDPSVMATACPEDSNDIIIIAAEKAKLENDARVVGKLEDVYSLLNKDRTSQTSLLTAEESWRFRRAMYRLMLFTNIFHSDRGLQKASENLHSDHMLFRNLREQRTAILNEYATGELQELSSASNFLHDVFEDVFKHRENAFLSTGPYGAVLAWIKRSYVGLEDAIDLTSTLYYNIVNPLYDGYLSEPLKNIWITRNLTLPEDEPSSKWILDSVNGANDTCSQCAFQGGLTLYNEANWFRFLNYINIHMHLKARLKKNATLLEPLDIATAHLSAAPELFAGPFIADLFMHRTNEFDGWGKADSYCCDCLREFVEEHFWRWLLEERIKDGWTPPENCRKGWNCRKQRDIHHAMKKNHLCDPISGGNAVA
ncbi:hypothetical protein B0H12DRAFT_52323 [Mycena haematopus]|nr:hypothetical protein B0H12DRAFT_52323 [Mycena haematopus]